MNRRGFALAALLAAASYAAAAQQPTAAPADPLVAPPSGPPYLVEGFRSARFGMADAELREAINRDFPRAAGAGAPRRTGEIEAQNNRVHRTTSLVIAVRDLMPDAGLARIEYILGHQTRALIQVNVIWGTPVEPNASLESITTPALRLQNFFAQENFAAERRLINAQMQDGSQLLFRGRDADGRTVDLVISAQQQRRPAGAGPQSQAAPATTHWLRLSYVLNPERPDVYSLRRGDF